MQAMRNLLRDLKSNMLDNVTFRRELERILRDDALNDKLCNELAQWSYQFNGGLSPAIAEEKLSFLE